MGGGCGEIGEGDDGVKVVGHDDVGSEENIWVAGRQGSPGLLNEGTGLCKGDLGVMDGAKDGLALVCDESDEVIGGGGVIELGEAELFADGMVGRGHGCLGGDW